MQSADCTWRARLARSRCVGGGTRRCRVAMPSASSAGDGTCRALTAYGVLVSRDRDAPVVVVDAAVRRCTPPAQLGSLRARAERRRHVVCSSRTIAKRLLRHLMRSRAALPSASSAGKSDLQSTDGTWRACLARAQRAGSGTWFSRAALTSTSAAGEDGCRARMAHGVLVPRESVAPAAATAAALRRCPLPAQLGRATADRRRHVVSLRS